jgi:hypothetical protein
MADLASQEEATKGDRGLIRQSGWGRIALSGGAEK